jgi:hypothetical protein
MLHKKYDKVREKTINNTFNSSMAMFQEFTPGDIQKFNKKCHIFYPTGKPVIFHFLRYQGLAVSYYSFTLDALELKHHRLLQQ